MGEACELAGIWFVGGGSPAGSANSILSGVPSAAVIGHIRFQGDEKSKQQAHRSTTDQTQQTRPTKGEG